MYTEKNERRRDNARGEMTRYYERRVVHSFQKVEQDIID